MITINGGVNVINLGDTEETLEDGDTITLLVAEDRDQIIAALRLWQHVKAEDIPLEIQEIACNGRESSLSDGEIDVLAEALNS